MKVTQIINRELLLVSKTRIGDFPNRLCSALVRTNVILAGKCHDHKSRHSTPSFSKNVGSGENKSCQVLGIFISFSDREMALPPSTEISELTFVVKKKYNHDAVQWRIQGRGPGARPPPLIFRPKWGPKGQKTFFWRPPLYLRVWMTTHPPPPPTVFRGVYQLRE